MAYHVPKTTEQVSVMKEDSGARPHPLQRKTLNRSITTSLDRWVVTRDEVAHHLPTCHDLLQNSNMTDLDVMKFVQGVVQNASRSRECSETIWRSLSACPRLLKNLQAELWGVGDSSVLIRFLLTLSCFVHSKLHGEIAILSAPSCLERSPFCQLHVAWRDRHFINDWEWRVHVSLRHKVFVGLRPYICLWTDGQRVVKGSYSISVLSMNNLMF